VKDSDAEALFVRSATQEDAAAVCRVHARAIREIAASHYTPEETEAWAGPRKPGDYLSSIRDDEFYVAEEDGEVVGFGTLKKSGEVEAVYVSPEATRRGVGSAILLRLEDSARDLGLTSLHLEASLNAIPFYEGAGYNSLRQSKHRLTSGVEIACLRMTKNLA